MRFTITLWLFAIVLFNPIYSQKSTIKGHVIDNDGQSVVNAVVYVQNTSNACSSNIDGNYLLQLTPGNNTIICTMVGYLKAETNIYIQEGQTSELNFKLEPDPTTTLTDAVVLGKSVIKQVEESGFNVVAIDATPYHNSSINITQVLDRTPGVKIQQEGGLGSSTNTTINGLSGKHVRFFIDGMPMDAMSSAFQMNNLPVNMAERIEVYKGVVPINFGSDALGGAVNIVTKKNRGTYVDASYSYGSFNTHLTFINAGHTTENGFTVQLNAYQNYSDNSYYSYAKIKDFDTNLYSKSEERVKHFHDAYHNETVIAKIGWQNKGFADQLLFGFTYGQEYDEIQNPAYYSIAFGDKYKTATTIMPSILYSKHHFILKQLDFSFTANYNLGEGHNIDTSDKEYNWLGESQESNSLGEMNYSDYVYKDNNGTINANLNYKITPNHRLTINNVANFFSREGDDKVATDDYINQKPRINNRNILGMSLLSDFGSRASVSVFAKRYSYYASAYLDTTNTDGIDNFLVVSNEDSKFGYGLTATYFLFNNLQLKGNFEHTYRLPVSEELFGQVYLDYVANVSLKPEESMNYNFGFNLDKKLGSSSAINADINLFYRETSNYIKRNIDFSQGDESYENIDIIKTPGVDGELRYSYLDKFNCGINLSYQDPTNYSKTTLYKASVPNQPNFFGNADATYILSNVGISESKLSFNYNLHFVQSFYNDWDTYQSADKVPTQWNHSLGLVYSWKEGTYNIAFDCKNIMDTKLYDNYKLMKPGRSFSVKLRYFFNKI